MSNTDRGLLTEFLLGRVEGPDRLKIEQELLLDEEIFDELEILVRELIDRYVRGELVPADAAACETHLLTSENGRMLLDFSRALHARSRREREAQGAQDAAAKSSWALVGLRLAAAILMLSGLGYGLLMLREEPRMDAAIVEAELIPGVVRGQTGTTVLELPAGEVEVRFHIAMPTRLPDGSSVRLEIRGPQGTLEVSDLPEVHDGLVSASVEGRRLQGEGEFFVLLFPVSENGRDWESSDSLPVAEYRFLLARE